MNLREANVMRGNLVDLKAKCEALENRLKLLEDALARIKEVTERANDGRRTSRSNFKSGATG